MMFHNQQTTAETHDLWGLPSGAATLSFEEPVIVLVGLGFPRMINGVGDAYALLNDWPYASRGPAHQVAINACRAALLGEIDAETARSTFKAFARKANIFAPQFTDLIAHQASESFKRKMTDAR